MSRSSFSVSKRAVYPEIMSSQTAELLQAFEALPDEDKRIVTAELLRRALPFESGPLEDDETARAADQLLSILDAEDASGE